MYDHVIVSEFILWLHHSLEFGGDFKLISGDKRLITLFCLYFNYTHFFYFTHSKNKGNTFVSAHIFHKLN